EQQDLPLIRNMLRRGTLRPHMNGGFHPGGIDADASQNVIGAAGQVHRNLWALGILAEGANFCTYVLPRALVNSRFIQFSGCCATLFWLGVPTEPLRSTNCVRFSFSTASTPGISHGICAH